MENARAELTEYCTGPKAGKASLNKIILPQTSGTCTGVIFLRKNKEVLKKSWQRPKKLPSGTWRCQVYDYTDDNGKRHYESFTADSKKRR